MGTLEEKGMIRGSEPRFFLVHVVFFPSHSLPHITNDTYSEHGVLKT